MASLAQIRNISIIAHIDAGKTTSTERMLYYSGASHRLGEVDDGNTVMDYLEEERQRGITIVAAAASFHWRDCLIHLIDTPGHIDFTAEVERSLRVIDGAVVIFSGVEGVEAQSEKVWLQADHYHVPRIAFINKLDRQGASFARVMGQINEKFMDKAVAIQMPVGSEDELAGLIDLIEMKLLTFTGDEGEVVNRAELPPELLQDASQQRQIMIEKLADVSDPIAEQYLEGEEIAPATIVAELRRAVLAGTLVPVLTGSAKRNLGIQPLVDAVVDLLPSPEDVPEIPATATHNGKPVTLEPDADGPFAGLVFKVVATTAADLYYLRTYRGVLKLGDSLLVSRTRKKIRAKRLLRLYAKNVEAIDEVGPGDIVGMVGPRDLQTGDTLCASREQVQFESMAFPEPVLSMAVEPRHSRDKDRVDESLALLCREDPTLAVTVDENTGQRLLAGMGELHLEVKIKRLLEEFNVATKCGMPRVAYRETICRQIIIEETFSKMVGEQELFAGVAIMLRPAERSDQLFTVNNTTRAKGLPKNLVAAAVQALTDGLKTGGNHGYPLIYVEAELRGLTCAGEKTTDGAVLGAVLQALDRAISEAGTALLEPLMRLEILTPEGHLGEVSNELTIRRGLIHDVVEVATLKRINCEVPLAEMFGFSKSLPKLTGGRGSFSMEPCGYKETEA